MISVFPDTQTTSNSETIIYYSKTKSVGWLLAYLLLESGTVYYFQTEQWLSAGSTFLLLCGTLLLFNICRQLLRLANEQPQLTLSTQGIRRAAEPLDLWESIQGEEVRAVQRGRGKEQVLFYKKGSTWRKLKLTGLAIDASQLSQLLLHYRTSFQQQALAKALAKYNL
jgi:hypothetical protein